MQIKLNFRSSEPIYLQIMEQVRELVATGELNPGDQLPTVRQLATDLRVNFNTVARAYRLLDEAGLISTQQGRGTYIWQRPSAEATLRLRQESLSTRTQTFLADAARLGFSPAEVRQAILESLDRWEVLGSPPDVEPQDPSLTE
jgi:GntR family transcriptional regulator